MFGDRRSLAWLAHVGEVSSRGASSPAWPRHGAPPPFAAPDVELQPATVAGRSVLARTCGETRRHGDSISANRGFGRRLPAAPAPMPPRCRKPAQVRVHILRMTCVGRRRRPQDLGKKKKPPVSGGPSKHLLSAFRP